MIRKNLPKTADDPSPAPRARSSGASTERERPAVSPAAASLLTAASQPGPDRLRFRLQVTCFGYHQYVVDGDGPPYRIQVRFAAFSDDRSRFNGDDAQWQREIVASIGLLHRAPESYLPVRQVVVDSFNAWRAAQDGESAAVRGAYYETGRGWIVLADGPVAQESTTLADAEPIDQSGPSA
jgi:hypothetical protein